MEELEPIKWLYAYSRSRFAKVHESKEFSLIYSFVYTQKLPNTDKSCLETIFDEEEKEIPKDRVRFAEAFNSLYKRLLKADGDLTLKLI